MYKLYAIIYTTGMYRMDIFYKIQRNELWKITQPHLITFSAGRYSHNGPYSSLTRSWCNGDQLRLRYIRTQSRPTQTVRPTTIIKPPPLHHSHFIQHFAVFGHNYHSYLWYCAWRTVLKSFTYNGEGARRILWNGVTFQKKSAFNLASH
jgi:hypothetical protein